MNIDFLQIGFQKCGTTFLAKNVYPSNPELECIQAAKNNELSRLLLHKFILPDGLEYDKETFEKEFKEISGTIFSGKETRVKGIMFEPFTFLYQRRFDRKNVIQRIHGSFKNIKVIMFIRSQESWLLSHYSQYLKSGGLLGLHDFIECSLSNPFLVAHYIDWLPLVSYLYELFGPERAFVCLYEHLRQSPQEVANKIFDFLGTPRSSIDKTVLNPSLSKTSLLLQRFLNHIAHFDCGAPTYSFSFRDLWDANPSVIAKARHKFVSDYYKRLANILVRGLDDIIGLFNGKQEIKLKPIHKEKIRLRYSDNNRKLSELLGIDLQYYGYP